MLSLHPPHVSSQYIHFFLRIRSTYGCRLSIWVMEFVNCLAQAVLDSQSVSLLVGKEQCLCFETQLRWVLTQSVTHHKLLIIHLDQPSGRHWGLLVTGKRLVDSCAPGKVKISKNEMSPLLHPKRSQGSQQRLVAFANIWLRFQLPDLYYVGNVIVTCIFVHFYICKCTNIHFRGFSGEDSAPA